MFKEYEELARRFLYELEMELYLNGAGLRSVVNTAAIYERYAPLFTEERVRTFKNASRNYDGEEKEIARRFYLFSCEHYLENAGKRVHDALLTMESTLEVDIDGEKCAFRSLSTKIQNENNRERRRKLFEAELGGISKLNKLYIELLKTLHEKASELGYGSYLELYNDLKNLDLPEFQEIMNNFLRNTENLYVEKMNAYLEKYNLKLEELEKHDIQFVFAGTEFDRYFPPDSMLTEIREVTDAMGMDITKIRGRERNVIIDMEVRPNKSPRAFVAPVDPPVEIYMVVLPQG
ncbi:MAG: hypothetical protein ACPL1Y_03460, partial [Thermoplasmata archaeon]